MRDGWQAQKCLLPRQGPQPWPSHCSGQQALSGRSTGLHANTAFPFPVGYEFSWKDWRPVQTGLLHHVDSMQNDSLAVSKKQIMSSRWTLLPFQSGSSCVCIPDREVLKKWWQLSAQLLVLTVGFRTNSCCPSGTRTALILLYLLLPSLCNQSGSKAPLLSNRCITEVFFPSFLFFFSVKFRIYAYWNKEHFESQHEVCIF